MEPSETLAASASGATRDRDTEAPARHLRVAIFSDSLPERNGTGAYYHDLADQLREHVAALRIFHPLGDVKHPRLAIPLPGDPTQKLISPNVPRIWRACRKLDPDIVVGVTPGPFGLLGRCLARRGKAAFITAFHTQFDQLARFYWNPVSRALAIGYLRGVSRLLCARARTTLINNSDLESEARDLGARTIDVMGTPVHSSFLSRPVSAPPAAIRQVCFAGRLAAEKNIEPIIDAARALPDIAFKIAGEGPLRETLKRAASDLNNVQFLGWIDREQLEDLIDGSSLLLLPSHVETFGSVALEAMARGRPALVSSGAGIHDWEHLADGLFKLEPGEPIADAIDAIRRLPAADLERRAESARAAAREFNDRAVRQWAEVLARHAP